MGKTTLARTVGAMRSSVYLDLESREDRNRLAEPALFLRNHQDRVVILDELYRMTQIFPVLRGLIDQRRRHGRRTGRFLVPGSASMDLLRQAGEILTGRTAYVQMGLFDILELPAESDTGGLWVRGGFPDSCLAQDDAASFAWRAGFIRSNLERLEVVVCSGADRYSLAKGGGEGDQLA